MQTTSITHTKDKNEQQDEVHSSLNYGEHSEFLHNYESEFFPGDTFVVKFNYAPFSRKATNYNAVHFNFLAFFASHEKIIIYESTFSQFFFSKELNSSFISSVTQR